jgi:hypothetical protein
MTTGAEMPDSPTVTAERFIPDLLPLVRPIAGLKIDPRNARKHPSSNLDSVKQSLLTSGQVKPIVVVADGTIIAGNGLVLAAQALGWMKIAAVTYPDAKTARRYALADNRTAELAEWDDDMLADEMKLLLDDGVDLTDDGWAADEIAKLTGSGAGGDCGDPEPQIDRAEELRKKWGVERGQVWTLGAHRLMCGDSTKAEDVARLLGGTRVPLTFTSPPYGVGIDYGVFDDTLVNVRKTIAALATVLANVTADGGYAVVNFGDIISAREALGTEEVCEYPMAVEYWGPFRDAGWLLHTRRVWAKPHARVAAPWCASSNRAATDWEHVWTWKRPGRGLNERREPSYLGVWDTSHGEGVAIGKDRFGAGMPVVLAHWVLEVYSNGADAVFEPFDGTGTTIIAAEQLGRRCYAMEIDPRYVAVALQRWVDATGGTPRKEGA